MRFQARYKFEIGRKSPSDHELWPTLTKRAFARGRDESEASIRSFASFASLASLRAAPIGRVLQIEADLLLTTQSPGASSTN